MLYLAIILITLGTILLILKLIYMRKNSNYPTKLYQKTHNFAILIPARYEENVIKNLLDSIQKQSFKINPQNVYVIVESEKDKTIKIVNDYHMNIIIRKKLYLKRKGYALMEAIEEITKTKLYDAYFIFDADNVLDKDFFSEMIHTYDNGYDIGIGYRNIKNKDNVISTSSILIFTIINNFLNTIKSKYSLTCYLSGTGFYISGKVINKLKTFPFHSLTEDYELSLYSVLNNLTTYYNPKAMFYDEQPNTFKCYFIQRTRWIKGFFEARKKYLKSIIKNYHLNKTNKGSYFDAIIGIYDILLIIIGLVVLILYLLISSTNKLLNISILLLIIYLVLIIITIILIKIDQKLQLSNSLKLKTIFIHPFLLLTYIPCAIKALITKNLEWNVIRHGK